MTLCGSLLYRTEGGGAFASHLFDRSCLLFILFLVFCFGLLGAAYRKPLLNFVSFCKTTRWEPCMRGRRADGRVWRRLVVVCLCTAHSSSTAAAGGIMYLFIFYSFIFRRESHEDFASQEIRREAGPSNL